MPGTHISPELLKELREASKRIKKNKGVILFRAGTPARGAYLVRKGHVELHLQGAGGLYPTRILGPGALLGLPATVSGEPYSLTAKVVEQSELDFIPRKQLLALLQRNTTAALQILRILSEEIYHMRDTAKKAYPTALETVH
jgi:CRP/FNR family transcriptional regulator, cyclic AMP receptor protein